MILFENNFAEFQACYFFSDCNSLDETCETCVSGEKRCKAETTTTASTTTEATTTTTTPTTTGEPGGDGEIIFLRRKTQNVILDVIQPDFL